MADESGFTTEVFKLVTAELHVHSILAAGVYVFNHKVSSEGVAIATSFALFGGTLGWSAYRHHKDAKAKRAAKMTRHHVPKLDAYHRF